MPMVEPITTISALKAAEAFIESERENRLHAVAIDDDLKEYMAMPELVLAQISAAIDQLESWTKIERPPVKQIPNTPWDFEQRETRHAESTYSCVTNSKNESLFDNTNSTATVEVREDHDEGSYYYLDGEGPRAMQLACLLPEFLANARAIIEWAKIRQRGFEGSELLEILSETQRTISKAEAIL